MPDLKQEMPDAAVHHAESSPGKPLGFDRSSLGSHFGSDQFSNFFNAYAKRFALTKPTDGPAVYSSIPSGACQLLRLTSFGM
jgi:hypothetical protein